MSTYAHELMNRWKLHRKDILGDYWGDVGYRHASGGVVNNLQKKLIGSFGSH
jgi:hypothetical protein